MYSPSALNARAQRQGNVSAVLQALLLHGPMPRQGLVKVTGLTGASISRITDDLLSRELLMESKGTATANRKVMGRPSITLDLNPDGATVASIQLNRGGPSRLGVHDSRGRLVRQQRSVIDGSVDPEKNLRRLRDEVVELVKASSRDTGRIVGLGVGMLNGVDDDGRIVERHPWDIPATDILSEGVDFPVIVDRLQRGLATAETWFGSAAGARSMAVLYVSEAVGCGLAVDGRVIRGHDYLEGHVGHLAVAGGRNRCDICSRTGCLQAQVSDAAFAASGREIVAARESMASIDIIDRIHAKARSGDRAAKRLVANRCRHIGHALSMITGIFDPEVIVLAGASLVKGWDLMCDPITDEWTKGNPLPWAQRTSKLQVTPFGEDAVLMASAAPALQRFYLSPERVVAGTWPSAG